jgi:hypothetical protein
VNAATAAVLGGAAVYLGWFLRGLRDKRLARQPKTIEQLAREQGVKPVRSIDDLPAADPAVFSEEDLASWDAAMHEVRGE